MRGMEGEKIADDVNAAGYCTGSKRFGQRLFTRDTINAILRNEFYAGLPLRMTGELSSIKDSGIEASTRRHLPMKNGGGYVRSQKACIANQNERAMLGAPMNLLDILLMFSVEFLCEFPVGRVDAATIETLRKHGVYLVLLVVIC